MTKDQAVAVLAHIDTGDDDCTVRQLAADTGLSRAVVARILDRLYEHGLVHSQVRDGIECWQLAEHADPDALDAVQWHEPPRKKARELPVEPWMLAADLRRVDTLEAFDRLERQLQDAREIAVDFETTGLDDAITPEGTTVDQIVGVCISYVTGQAFYVPVRHIAPAVNIPVERAEGLLRALHARAAAGSCTILFWHARFDLAFWRAIDGCDEWSPAMFRDGMLLSQHDFPADRHGLKEQAEAKLGMRMYRLSQLSRERRPARQLPPDLEGLGDLTEYLRPDSTPEYSFAKLDPTRIEVLRYACGDALATFELARLGGPFEQTRIQRAGQIKLDQLLIPILTRWERQLIGIDRKLALEKLTAAWAQRQKIDKALRQWAAARGCEHKMLTTSTVAISDFLFGTLEVKPPKRPTDAARAKHEKGGPLRYPTDEGVLEKLSDHPVAAPFCRALLALRRLDKEINTYLANFVCNAHGRERSELRANIRCNGAATTGRFSSPLVEGRGVPFHGIPRPSPTSTGHRDLVVARAGFRLLKVDYAGQELRIIANLSGDPAMLALFDHDAPCDPHTATARILFANESLTKADKHERDIAKRVGFAIHYGAGPAVVQREITCTLAEATAFVQRMRAARPVAFAWAASLGEQSRTCGFIRTGFDRIIDTRCYEWRYEFDPLEGRNVRRRAQLHNVDDACNYTVQGTGSDVLKFAKLKLERWIQRESLVEAVRPLLSVHDEILFEVRTERVPELQPEIIGIMESVSPAHWRIPLVCEAQVGPTWAGE